MSRATIELPENDMEVVLTLVRHLQGKVLDTESARKPDPERAFAALNAIVASGGIKSIPDPSAWQREIRKDKPLHGREE